MGYTWSELEAFSDDELIAMHDRMSDHTVSASRTVVNELTRRQLQRSADATQRLAEQAVEEARLQRQIAEANLEVARTAKWLALAALVASLAAIVVPLLSG